MHPLPQFRRKEVEVLVARLEAKPRRLICVVGPRQCGKTTAVLQGLGLTSRQNRYIAVDEPSSSFSEPSGLAGVEFGLATGRPRDVQWLIQVWERARTLAKHSENGFILVLDEIHTIGEWHSAVKGLWDADRRHGIQLHVVLLGSAPLLMREGLMEALTGRFEQIRLAHWSLDEMASAFNATLDEFIYFGGYPGMHDLKNDENAWHSVIRDAIIDPSVEKDVLALVRVDKPALLRQLFEIGTAYSGQIVSYNKMLGQLQDVGNATTLKRYLDLLSRVGLLRGLPKYAGNIIRQRASTPKLQVLNTALMTASAGYTFDEAQTDRSYWGHLVESAVGAHLCNTATTGVEVFYWREGNLEVDFVVRCGRRLVGIEVKSGKRIGCLQGLKEFGHRFKADRLLTIGRGGMPLKDFLAIPAPDLCRS